MKADYIEKIISEYENLPYRCILFNGAWGVGKSYAIEQALCDKKNVCNISMFGLKDAQEIYHEVFVQLLVGGKYKISGFVSKLMDEVAETSDKIAVAKGILATFVKEKEMFLNTCKSFKKYRFIIIDDLERMNDNIELEEVFGIIEELKKCNYVKVILVANTTEISSKKKELFDTYSEKVIDRTYCITEHSERVDWKKLNIHYGFITKFLKNHNVKNLRTLQKAQNLYDDVKLKLKKSYLDEFYDEIHLACFAIVVETIDKLYYKEPDANQNGSVVPILQNTWNTIEYRIKNNYLQGTRISQNMVELLKQYYESEIDLLEDEIEAEYQLFIHAGEKANFYKSDQELKRVLPNLADDIRKETNIAKLLHYADEYIMWSECLQIDIDKLLDEYKEKLYDMIFAKVLKGNTEYLTYGIESFYIHSQTNKNIVKEVIEKIKIETVRAYVEYLSQNTEDEKAYQYSYFLKNFQHNDFLKDAIYGNIDSLYNERSFPIEHVTEQTYRTSYNIMYVLYHDNKERFLEYCAEVKKKCDNMATHRIDTLLEKIEKEN